MTTGPRRQPASGYTPAHLAVIRTQLGLSLRELAHLAGVTDRRVRAWLAGESRPSPAACHRITEALENFHTEVNRRTTELLRSRARPVILTAATAEEIPVVAAVATVLDQRHIAYAVASSEPGQAPS